MNLFSFFPLTSAQMILIDSETIGFKCNLAISIKAQNTSQALS